MIKAKGRKVKAQKYEGLGGNKRWTKSLCAVVTYVSVHNGLATQIQFPPLAWFLPAPKASTGKGGLVTPLQLLALELWH